MNNSWGEGCGGVSWERHQGLDGSEDPVWCLSFASMLIKALERMSCLWVTQV